MLACCPPAGHHAPQMCPQHCAWPSEPHRSSGNAALQMGPEAQSPSAPEPRAQDGSVPGLCFHNQGHRTTPLGSKLATRAREASRCRQHTGLQAGGEASLPPWTPRHHARPLCAAGPREHSVPPSKGPSLCSGHRQEGPWARGAASTAPPWRVRAARGYSQGANLREPDPSRSPKKSGLCLPALKAQVLQTRAPGDHKVAPAPLVSASHRPSHSRHTDGAKHPQG